MSERRRVSNDRAKSLLRREDAGERLTAVEWADLAVWHADRSVRFANWSLGFASVGVVFATISIILRACGA